MFQCLKKLFGKSMTVDDILQKSNIAKDSLEHVNVSFDIDSDALKREKFEELAAQHSLELQKGESHFSGMEAFSFTSNAITILSFLVTLEKWVGNRYYVNLKINEVRQRVTINDAIKHILGLGIVKTE